MRDEGSLYHKYDSETALVRFKTHIYRSIPDPVPEYLTPDQVGRGYGLKANLGAPKSQP